MWSWFSKENSVHGLRSHLKPAQPINLCSCAGLGCAAAFNMRIGKRCTAKHGLPSIP